MKTRRFFLSLAAIAVLGATGLAAADANSEPVKATTPGVTKVARIKGMDKAPEVVKQVAPVYPRELRAEGVQGYATVDLLIDSTGRVVDVAVVKATDPRFGERAAEAARQWSFRPAEARGQKIMTRVQVPFEFVMPQIAALEQR